MGTCPHCESESREVVESDTGARYTGDATVWECAACGAILGITEVGV
jgi:uncharacterized Zn finger protein